MLPRRRRALTCQREDDLTADADWLRERDRGRDRGRERGGERERERRLGWKEVKNNDEDRWVSSLDE